MWGPLLLELDPRINRGSLQQEMVITEKGSLRAGFILGVEPTNNW